MTAKTKRRAQIVDLWFLITTFIVTIACFTTLALLLRDIGGWPVWVLLALSVVPIYSTIYQTVLFAKAAFFHRQWTVELPPPTGKLDRYPGIAFVIASYQEPFEVAKMTFDCAYLAPYDGPREIVIVDNSHDTESEDFLRWKGYVEEHDGRDPNIRVVFLYNTKQGGLKPGNIDLAQEAIQTSEYVVILDIDSSIPLHDDLLTRSVNEFENDETLGILQYYTIATNDHFNHLTGPVAVGQNGLRIKHLIRGDGGFAMFLGHNAMWRKALLDINGPWLEHYRGKVMIAEDLLKTVTAYVHGYTTRYMDVPTGEWIPSSIDALESMWMRWTYGSYQVLFKYFKQIATAKGLPFMARFDLLFYLIAYSVGGLIYPLSFLWVLIYPPLIVGILTSVMIIVPPLIYAHVVHRRYTSQLSISSSKKFWDLYAGFFLIDTFILAVSLRGAFNFLVGLKQGWRVTSKGLEEKPGAWQVITRNIYVTGVATLVLIALFATWGWHTGFALERIPAYLPLAFFATNLLLCVFIYGRQVREEEASIEGTTIDKYTLRNEVLDKVPLFHGTNALFQHQVALSLKSRRFAAGDIVVQKGDSGDEMFLVADGEVEVVDAERALRTMGKGGFFGERSLIFEQPRTATVRAKTDCDLLVLDKEAFQGILKDQPRVAKRVTAQVKEFSNSDLTRGLGKR